MHPLYGVREELPQKGAVSEKPRRLDNNFSPGAQHVSTSDLPAASLHPVFPETNSL